MTQADRSARCSSRRLWLAAIAALILLRTLPYVLFASSLLDSDQAIYALMGKHLMEGRAFPVFMYGQKFLLGQSSWLAAPLFKVFGPSAPMFALPLLIMNLAAGLLLYRMLQKETRLGALAAFVCCLWFILPSMDTARSLMNGSEGTIEPFLYLLAIWALKDRPLVGGLIAGVGLAGRPFVLYGIVALLLMEFWLMELRRERRWKALWDKGKLWVAGSALSYGAIQVAARFSTNYFGGGTPFYAKSVRHMLEDVRGYFAEIVPQTLGLQVQGYHAPPVPPPVTSHWSIPGLALALAGAILLFFLFRGLFKNGRQWVETCVNEPSLRFPLYLVLIGAQSFGAYVVLSPPTDDIRYTFQLLFGVVGLYALQARLCRDGRLRKLSMLLLLGCVVQNAVANARVWSDLSSLHREHPTRKLITYLTQHDIRAALGTYWCAHNITFLSGESVIVDTGRGSRIPANTRFLLQTPSRNRAEISLAPCPGGVQVESWYVCPLAAGWKP